ncbi:hypothetical protein HHK36_005715 [Tetracentron sinense]|uniref:Uncharacterized protein n=1 Tax=Tetracentron sinense TaxID=13715 RepID=A0A835DRA8_TETSI|nr:hypothetical protein HHK36_005715 [Tetracentron sinense]
MAEALLALFLGKLGEQLIQEGELFLGVHEDIEWIKSELHAMGAFLKDADKRRRRDEGVEAWVGQVRDLVYDADDVVDDFVIRMGTLHRNAFSFLKQYRLRRRVCSQIRKIKRDVIEVKARRDRYGFQVAQEEASNSHVSSRGPGAASPFVEEHDIVGIEEDVEQLTKWLLKGDQRHRLVISVVGMGGLGKTTLVKEVYKNIKMRFECYSWVFVSQSYTVRDVLRNILFGFKSSKGEPALDVMDAMDEGQLQERIYHYLQDKRYVLVLDDIWDARVWEEVKHALPSYRGRVIFTTRIRDLVSPIDDINHIYDLQPLSYELAWSIFCKKAFAKETCPEDSKEYTEAIVRRCGGLPLAIVTIGALMSNKGTNPPEWYSVLHTLSWELNHNRDLERLNTALLLSYNHLPFYLKYCFLYVGLFPEDYEIGRKRLIRMWVAEGFVRRSPGKTEEEVANNYFTKLIGRSMIQAITLHARDVVKACRIHDLMRDVAVHIFKQEKFGSICEHGDNTIEERQRRLSICNNANNIPLNMSKLHLRSFLMFRISELSSSTLRKMLPDLKLLRVLDLQGVPIEILPNELGNLIHLRYLDLRGTLIENLPKSLQNLRNLQTLDVRNTKVKSFPSGMNMLQQLRHLHMASFRDRDEGFAKMGRGTKCFKCLQTLSGVESDEDLVNELKSLTSLRKLYIGKMNITNCKKLCDSLMEMKNLRSLTVISEGWLELLQLESLSRPPPYLEKLKLQGPMHRLPKWFRSLSCLHTLYLFKSLISEDPFLILQGLPNLVVLTLASSAYLSEEIGCDRGGFPKLKLLRILDNDEWVTWKPILEGTMPSLKYLLIADCPKLMRLPEGFQYLTALQDLTLTGMSIYFLYKLRETDHSKVRHVPEVSVVSQIDGAYGTRDYCIRTDAREATTGLPRQRGVLIVSVSRRAVVGMATEEGRLCVFIVYGRCLETLKTHLMDSLKKLSSFPLRFFGIGGALILCTVALLVCSLFVEVTNAREIHYNPIKGGDPGYHCGKNNAEKCLPPPSNGYNRGCEKKEGCRNGDKKGEFDDKKVEVKEVQNNEPEIEHEVIVMGH